MAWVRADSSPPRSPEVIELEIEAPVGRRARHFELRGVELVRYRAQLIGVLVEHQRLAIAQVHVDRAVGVARSGDAHELRQIRDQLVTLVEQLVRGLPRARALRDLRVEGRDLRADGIDLIDVRGDAGVDVRVQSLELRARGVEVGGERVGIAEQRLSGGRGGRVIGHCGPAAVIGLQRRGQAAGGGAEQVVDLAGVVLQRRELRQGALRGVELGRGRLAVGALHARDIDARADREAAGILRKRGIELDRFLVVPRRARVRDVVARDLDGLLKGLKCR